jgi:hypothetical protein
MDCINKLYFNPAYSVKDVHIEATHLFIKVFLRFLQPFYMLSSVVFSHDTKRRLYNIMGTFHFCRSCSVLLFPADAFSAR